MDDGGQTEEESCLMGVLQQRGMKRLTMEGGKLDRAAGISLGSVVIERWVSHIVQLNQHAVKAAHYQTKTWMKAVRADT